MNKILSATRKSAGFTLIELLVVIGILGILAAALVATIDPFEQLKKANDANNENAQVELINALIRYYTIHNAFPWDPTNSGGTACTTDVTAGTGQNDLDPIVVGDDTPNSGFAACLTDLIDNGELKAAFDDAEGLLDDIVIYETNTAITTCYDPESKSKTEDQLTNMTVDATNDSVTNGSNCVGIVSGNHTDENCYKCTSG